MHTSGYLGEYLNSFTGLAGEPLHPEVFERYQATARYGGDVYKMLHNRAMKFALECNDRPGSYLQTPCMELDPYWSSYLTVDRLDPFIEDSEREVSMSVFGKVPGLNNESNRLSIDFVLRPDSVEVDDDFQLLPYEAAGLCIDLMAGRYTLMLVNEAKSERMR